MPRGLTAGAAYKHDFQRDIQQLYQRENYAAQVRQEKERKTMYYAELLKQGHAESPYNTKRLDAFYDGLNKKIADFAIENPNFETDVTKMQAFMNLSDQYLNNDILREDMQVKQEFEKLRDAVSKGDITKSEYEEEAARYASYINQEPDTLEKADPYVFIKPNRVSMGEILEDGIGTIKPGLMTAIKNGQIIEMSDIDPDAFIDTADRLYSDEDYRKTIDKAYAEAGHKIAPTPQEYLEQLLRYGVPLKNTLEGYTEEYKAMIKNAAAEAGVQDYYSKFVSRMRSKLQGGDGVVEANSNTIALTGFMKSGQQRTLNPTGDERFMLKNEKGEVTTANINLPINFTAKTGGNLRVIGGIPYIEVTGSVHPPGKSDKGKYGKPDKEYVDMLEGAGFELEQIETEGYADVAIDPRRADRVTYTGTLLVPMQNTPSSILEYNKANSGVADATEINTTINQRLVKAASVGDITLTRSILKQNYGIENGRPPNEDEGFDNTVWVFHKGNEKRIIDLNTGRQKIIAIEEE